jgi:hypothetical protein
MRAWIAILHERHPEATWIPCDRQEAVVIRLPALEARSDGLKAA